MMDFIDIVRAHQERYPLMQPQDYAKLAFQSEFGPGHMIADERSAALRIAEEWQSVSIPAVSVNPEPIGNGLCRFHLTGTLYTAESAETLAKLFARSAREHAGTRQGLEARLKVLAQLDVDGMKAWLAKYRAQGCPPVHHSEPFREAYHPHYRVVLEQPANRLYALLTAG